MHLARLDPADNDLYVVNAQLNAVSVFAVTAAGLSELNASPFALPKGATPFGIVVT
jgi:DNA-binding beta-propeller fold protein YncE